MPSNQSLTLSDLILGRLLLVGQEGLTKSVLKEAVKSIAASQLSASALSERIGQILEQLTEEGYAETVGKARYKSTEKGSQYILDKLGLEALPNRIQWSRFRNTDWIAYSLGLPALTTENRKRLASADGLRAAILQSSFEPPTDAFSTLTKTRNALMWKQFCDPTMMEDLQEKLPELSQTAFTQGSVMGLLLNHLLRSPKPLKWDQALKQLVAKSVNAKRTDPNELRLAVLRQSLGDLSAQPSPKNAPDQPSLEESLILDGLSFEDFTATVLAAARETKEGRFGENKVFISQVWKTLSSQHPDWNLTLETFKQRLLEASRKDLVRLSRADMGYLLDPDKVTASEIVHLNSQFHFIRID